MALERTKQIVEQVADATGLTSSTSHHPLDPLTEDEIAIVVELVRKERGDVAFNSVSLLEPKKKDLKERGSESWPEGEEPRLRCTFCRRTYAGINAKSMWRRHVFEKHKVPMSNRRDNSERARKTGGSE